jgi:hypothetical protein
LFKIVFCTAIDQAVSGGVIVVIGVQFGFFVTQDSLECRIAVDLVVEGINNVRNFVLVPGGGRSQGNILDVARRVREDACGCEVD